MAGRRAARKKRLRGPLAASSSGMVARGCLVSARLLTPAQRCAPRRPSALRRARDAASKALRATLARAARGARAGGAVSSRRRRRALAKALSLPIPIPLSRARDEAATPFG